MIELQKCQDFYCSEGSLGRDKAEYVLDLSTTGRNGTRYMERRKSTLFSVNMLRKRIQLVLTFRKTSSYFIFCSPKTVFDNGVAPQARF